MLKEIRCGRCQRLLAKGSDTPRLEIKRPRCKTINHFEGHEPNQTDRLGAALRDNKNGASG